MKLLYLMTEPLGMGGVQSDMLALSKGLTAKKHEYYLATLPGEMSDEFAANGGQLLELDFQYSGLGGLYRAAKALRKLIVQHEIDVVAPQSVRTAIVAWVATRLMPFSYRVKSSLKRVPLVTTIHNIHSAVHFNYAGAILRLSSDYVIFESNYERDRLLASGLKAEQSTVIHSGIDLERFRPLAPELGLAKQWSVDTDDDIVLAIVARLSEEKGHQYLFEALSIARQSRPNLKLLVIGDGPLMGEHVKHVSDLSLNDSVTFTGSQRNVQQFLSFVDVFVLSSTRESFPLAAREAMAAGTAVIAPRIGGCGEVVDEGKTGLLFEAANAPDLAEKILTMTADKQYEVFGRAARERTETLFSLEAWIDGDEAVYERFHAKR